MGSIERIESYVKKKMEGEPTGHDWHHVDRVRKLSLLIAQNEKNVDFFLVEASALLHDIGDWKMHGKESNEEEIVRNACHELKVLEKYENEIVDIITNMSFSSNLAEKRKLSIEGKIVQDADRLEALGAIGIARAFAYGGKKNREIYNPNSKPQLYTSTDSYRNSNSTTINHFYEKLFLIRKELNTKTAKVIAIKREKFMQDFLKEFYSEWDVKI